jgi:hypothetical protein
VTLREAIELSQKIGATFGRKGHTSRFKGYPQMPSIIGDRLVPRSVQFDALFTVEDVLADDWDVVPPEASSAPSS